MPLKIIEARLGTPTPIQFRGVPEIEKGKNVLLIAPTGHGKTEAAFIPIIKKLKEARDSYKPISLLYITPLRALNRDLLLRLEKWANEFSIKISVRHGDTKQSERTSQLRNPPQILITTPESLQALLCAPKMRENLRNIKFVIIDEVHELYGVKRGVHLSCALKRLSLISKFQRIGLSATVFSPKKVAEFFGFNEVIEEGKKEMELKVIFPKIEEEDAKLSVELHVQEDVCARLRAINEIIKKEKAILFTNTRSTAEFLSSRLKKFQNVLVHHGSLSKEARLEAEEKFKKEKERTIVATSSLELGIDVGEVEHVIQYNSPRQVSRLLQRIGRSGHREKKTAKGTIIAANVDDFLEAGVIARRAVKRELEKKKDLLKPLDVLAHQIAGMILERSARTVDEAFEIMRTVPCYSSLTIQEFHSVCSQLWDERIIFMKEGIIGANKKTRLYYYENISVIPSEKKYTAIDTVGERKISTLDEKFVSTLGTDEAFILAGVPWKLIDIQGDKVLIEQLDHATAGAPAWEGEEIPVLLDVAKEAGFLTKKIVNADEFELRKISSEYCFEYGALLRVRSFLKEEKEIADDEHILIEDRGNGLFIMHSCAGNIVNETIAHSLSFYLTSIYGKGVRLKSSAYRIILECSGCTSKALLDALEKKIVMNVESTGLFRWKFTHVAKLFGLIEKDAEFIPGQRFIFQLKDTPVFEETRRTVLFEYFDEAQADAYLHECRKKVYKGVLKLGEWEIERSFLEVFVPLDTHSLILRNFIKTTLEKEEKFKCSYCNKIFYARMSELPEKIKCMNCGSSMMGLVWGEKMKEEELLESANIISSSGKKGAMALSVYGIGAETAKRILRHSYRTEEEFFLKLLEAQRNFIRNKYYWK